MKKRLVLGDMHGLWETYLEIYDKENPDEVICLGDYVDSFTVGKAKQEYGVKELFALKRRHESAFKGRFIILLGNHDFHYLYGYPTLEKYSGFNWTVFRWAHPWFNNAMKEKLISIIYADYKNKIVYSHAGITNTWINDWNLKIYDINDKLNATDTLDFLKIRYDHYDAYGENEYNSPIWVRPTSLFNDMFIDDNKEKWTQIVGHTGTEKISISPDEKLFLCDTIPHKEYLMQYLDDEGKIINYEIHRLD